MIGDLVYLPSHLLLLTLLERPGRHSLAPSRINYLCRQELGLLFLPLQQ